MEELSMFPVRFPMLTQHFYVLEQARVEPLCWGGHVQCFSAERQLAFIENSIENIPFLASDS